MHIGRNAGSPRCIDVHATSVGELPSVKIALALQHVSGVRIVHRPVDGHLYPVFSETALQAFHHHCRARGVLLGHLAGSLIQVVHVVVETIHRECVHVPHGSAVDGGVKHESESCVPVSVDVLRPCGSSAGFLIISHHV